MSEAPAPPDTRVAPDLACDVVMKGGITSGVIYPGALVELAGTYRFRGLGGASAGAIGAAVGAAAEYGRATGGFETLAEIPQELSDGALGELFQPQPATRPLMRLLQGFLAGRTGRAVLVSLLRVFPVASLLGALPGLACVVVGLVERGLAGWLLTVAGLLLVVVGWLVAIGLRLRQQLTVALPGNLFGICRGLGTDAGSGPGFTDWLSSAIDRCAGLPEGERPLTFGDLWDAHRRGAADPEELERNSGRDIDLRMITTCLSLGRPFELPMQARYFFYEPAVWRTLFPAYVVDALERASDPVPAPGERLNESTWEVLLAGHGERVLRRLPEARLLPVIVATRLSLSFPVLISAIPLWTVDRLDQRSQQTLAQFRRSQQDGTPHPTSGLVFSEVWFSDGGLCSNFPVHLFDAALSSRPTFAINLGGFPPGRLPNDDERLNLDYATTNNEGVIAPYTKLPDRGLGALTGFATLAVNTARNWQDSSHLSFPGFRDRIVRVLQTVREGGLNLDMDGGTIDRLGRRGRAAAAAMVDQFTHEHYKAPTGTGWDNHRWVRYRALLSCLPDWLGSWSRGRQVLDIDASRPPSYPFSSSAGRQLADDLATSMDAAAAVLRDADELALADLTGEPNPQGVIRRIPRT
jgi:predicted acylesterase/phospholipase RssA